MVVYGIVAYKPLERQGANKEAKLITFSLLERKLEIRTTPWDILGILYVYLADEGGTIYIHNSSCIPYLSPLGNIKTPFFRVGSTVSEKIKVNHAM